MGDPKYLNDNLKYGPWLLRARTLNRAARGDVTATAVTHLIIN